MKNKYYLPGLEEWDDFDRVVGVLTKTLGWTLEKRYEGPDAQVAKFAKGPLRVTLVYDDMHGLKLKCEGDASHLPAVAQEILSALS